MKKKSGIYQIKNLLNGKKDIGSTVDFKKRWTSYHRPDLRKNRHFNQHLQNAWNKYGEANFVFLIVEEMTFPDHFSKEHIRKHLLAREQWYLDNWKPEYNICKTAGSSLGIKHSEETKRNMSKAHMGKRTGKNNPFYGKSHSEETKQKIREANIGQNNPNYKKSRSKETKNKIAIANQGENCGTSKLTRKKVFQIRQKLYNGAKNIDLAKEYRVSPAAISEIKLRRTWKHI